MMEFLIVALIVVAIVLFLRLADANKRIAIAAVAIVLFSVLGRLIAARATEPS